MINVTAAVAAAALVAILTGIVTLLARASTWPVPTPPRKHEIADHPDGYRPRPWDEVTGDLPEAVAPISAPPVPVEDDEPIDELDPRWDWKAYADAADAAEERELVAA
jgi:hypothetical protein